jgi:hypothetical protein
MPGAVELIIPNLAEYFLRDTALSVSERLRSQVTTFGSYEADHVVLWSSNPRILLLPEGLDPVWFEDIHRVLGLAAPPVISPVRRTGLLIQDLLRDGTAQQSLRRALSGYDVVRLVTFGPTTEVYRLADLIRGCGLAVELDCVPEDAYWCSLYLDNKISIIEIAAQRSGVNVAPAITVSSAEELHGAVDLMLRRHGRIIARALHGFGGDGSAITTADPDQLAEFYDTLARDEFFAYPMLVQKFIEQAPGVGCPAADFLIDDEGVREIVPCALTVENGRNNNSVKVGPDALPPEWARRLTDACHEVGRAHHALGYRGWTCVDCLAGADGKLYVTEINARRTGSMHAGGLMRWLKADGTLTCSVHFVVRVPAGTSYQRDIRPIFEPLWEAGVRAYPTSLRALSWPDPIMAVIAAAPTAAEAERIIADIEAALGAQLVPAA